MTDEQEILKLALELSEAKAEIARLTDLAQQRKWQLEECESDLAKAEAEIARLTDYNARLHADIAEIGKDSDELEAEIAATMDRLVNFNLEMTRELSEAKAEIAR